MSDCLTFLAGPIGHCIRPVFTIVCCFAVATLAAWSQHAPAVGTLHGEVIDAVSNAGLGGAHVRIIGTAFSTVTRHDGTYGFAGVPAGRYRVAAAASGFAARTISDVTVGAHDTVELRIALHRSALPQDAPVLTAGRRLQSLKETTASTTVINADALRNGGAVTLERALERVPGAIIQGSQISLRGSDGCGLSASRRVGLLVDGLPYLAPDDGGITSSIVPLAAADHIEVIRGASSATYGSGALGGLISVITRDPAEEPQGYIRGYTGFYTPPSIDSWGWSGGAIQRFSGIEGRFTRRAGGLGVLVAGSYSHDDGYRQNDRSDSYDIFGRIGWTLSPQLQMRFSAALAEVDRGAWLAWRGADSALYSSGSQGEATRRRITANTAFFGEIAAYGSPAFSLTARGIYQRIAHRSQGGDPAATALPGITGADRFFGEAQIISHVNQRVVFTYGGSMEFSVGEARGVEPHVLRTTSLHAQMEFGNGRDITTTVGGRFDLLLAPGTAQQNQMQLSPRVGVSYRPFRQTALRISLGRGFRAPSIVERYSTATIHGLRVRPNPQLGPEQSWQGEVGATHELLLPLISLTADVTLYMNEYFSMIEPVVIPAGGEIMFHNVTRARILGADVLLSGRLRGLPLRAELGLSRLSASDVRTAAPLPCRPDLALSMRAGWTAGPLDVVLVYRYRAELSSVDDVMHAVVADASYQRSAGVVDLTSKLDLQPLMRVPLIGTLTARNILQSNATDGVGSVIPLRNFELGVEGRF